MEGATTLIACAQTPMDPSNLAKITTDPTALHSINLLIFLTRFAIITNWLRRVEESSPDFARAAAVLDAFQNMTFSTMPNELRPEFFIYIQSLTASVTELHEIVGEKNVPSADISRRMLRWCKGWLAIVLDDEAFLKQTSLLWGAPFFAYVHGAMGSLAKSVEAVLYEEQ